MERGRSQTIALGLLGVIFCLCVEKVKANTPSYRIPHPVGWMHMLPVGEMPGWTSDYWMNFELAHANIWNAPLQMQNRDTGRLYDYFADFEHSHLILDTGFALTENLAFGIEVPYTVRGGGVMDQFIDNFHVFIGSDRFRRPDFEKDQSIWDVKSGSVDQIEEMRPLGVSNIKYKLKYWLLKWRASKPGACDCGLGISAQYKQSLSDPREGLSSGEDDYSFLWHLGIPLGDSGGLWATGAYTHTRKNEVFADWPRREWHQMYEISLDIPLGDHWGFMFQIRMESPILQKELLSIIDNDPDARQRLINRVASGWNSLVHWRGSQSFGLRYRFSEGDQLNFLFIEDWAIGSFDEIGDDLYVNNAPDVIFTFQFAFNF